VLRNSATSGAQFWPIRGSNTAAMVAIDQDCPDVPGRPRTSTYGASVLAGERRPTRFR